MKPRKQFNATFLFQPTPGLWFWHINYNYSVATFLPECYYLRSVLREDNYE